MSQRKPAGFYIEWYRVFWHVKEVIILLWEQFDRGIEFAWLLALLFVFLVKGRLFSEVTVRCKKINASARRL